MNAGHTSLLEEADPMVSLRRLKAMIEQTTGNMPHIQEILNGLLCHIEWIESRMDDPIGLGAFFNGYDDLSGKEEKG